MKKFYLVFAVLAIAALALSACGSASPEENCADEDVLCVGLVTDVGEIDDKSFNQSAWEGVQLAVDEFDAFTKYVETKDAKDYASNIGLFADKNYDVIVTVGFAMGDATIAASAE